MEKDSKSCPLCDTKMRPDGYEGNWKVFECTSDSCTGTVLKPVADVTESEFTVEDLNHIAEFND